MSHCKVCEEFINNIVEEQDPTLEFYPAGNYIDDVDMVYLGRYVTQYIPYKILQAIRNNERMNVNEMSEECEKMWAKIGKYHYFDHD